MTQENSNSEKDLFDWGVLSCGRLMETYASDAALSLSLVSLSMMSIA